MVWNNPIQADYLQFWPNIAKYKFCFCKIKSSTNVPTIQTFHFLQLQGFFTMFPTMMVVLPQHVKLKDNSLPQKSIGLVQLTYAKPIFCGRRQVLSMSFGGMTLYQWVKEQCSYPE